MWDESVKKFAKHTVLRSGNKGIVKIYSDKYISLEKYENVPFLGRFTIRDEN